MGHLKSTLVKDNKLGGMANLKHGTCRSFHLLEEHLENCINAEVVTILSGGFDNGGMCIRRDRKFPNQIEVTK